MIATDEDALVCDFAETYQVFDYKSLPARFAATLAAGLRDDSRIKMKMAGVSYSTETLMLAMAVDRLSLLFWARTEDGQKNRNRPESIYAKLLGIGEKTENDIMSFENAEEFKTAWNCLAGGGETS